jgi:hypothetical protein
MLLKRIWTSLARWFQLQICGLKRTLTNSSPLLFLDTKMRDEDGGCITSGALEEARDAAGLYHLACRNARDTLRTTRGGGRAMVGRLPTGVCGTVRRDGGPDASRARRSSVTLPSLRSRQGAPMMGLCRSGRPRRHRGANLAVPHSPMRRSPQCRRSALPQCSAAVLARGDVTSF